MRVYLIRKFLTQTPQNQNSFSRLTQFSNVTCQVDETGEVEAYYSFGINIQSTQFSELTNTQDVLFVIEGSILAEADVDDMVMLDIVSMVCSLFSLCLSCVNHFNS